MRTFVHEEQMMSTATEQGAPMDWQRYVSGGVPTIEVDGPNPGEAPHAPFSQAPPIKNGCSAGQVQETNPDPEHENKIVSVAGAPVTSSSEQVTNPKESAVSAPPLALAVQSRPIMARSLVMVMPLTLRSPLPSATLNDRQTIIKSKTLVAISFIM